MGTLTLSLCSAFGRAAVDGRLQPYTAASDISGALSAAYTVTVFHGLTPETVTASR